MPFIPFIFIFIIVFTPIISEANNFVYVKNKNTSDENYWTHERLRDAKPLPLPISKIFSQNKVNKFDRGTSQNNFTSSQLIPNTADLEYPYRTVGKLFFSIPGQGNFTCTAVVIKPRIILTAGHCVNNGTRTGFYSNFRFIPAFRNNEAPFQTWNWSYAAVTGPWSTSNGELPNAAAFGMIELKDNIVNGQTKNIGEVVGTLAVQTSNFPNHVTLLGYPCNLDNCQRMHQTTGLTGNFFPPNNVSVGTDMGLGSAGSPWIANFGVLSEGQTLGPGQIPNAIIGVTSFLFSPENQMARGSSIPDNNFTDLLNFICAHNAGNC